MNKMYQFKPKFKDNNIGKCNKYNIRKIYYHKS